MSEGDEEIVGDDVFVSVSMERVMDVVPEGENVSVLVFVAFV